MALTNRQRGDYFERQVLATLRFHGWLAVRSAGSLGVADIWAARHDKTLMLVSCKISGRIDPKERAVLLAAAAQAGGRAVLAMRPRGGRVLMAAIVHGSARAVPLETLQVPPRDTPAELVDAHG